MRFLVAIGVFVLVVVVWQVQAWRYGAQIERLSAAQTQKALHLQQAEQDRRLALEQQLSAIDQQHARELSDAQRMLSELSASPTTATAP